jgi:hypothetical protein
MMIKQNSNSSLIEEGFFLGITEQYHAIYTSASFGRCKRQDNPMPIR